MKQSKITSFSDGRVNAMKLRKELAVGRDNKWG